jgi:hypothetical protein
MAGGCRKKNLEPADMNNLSLDLRNQWLGWAKLGIGFSVQHTQQVEALFGKNNSEPNYSTNYSGETIICRIVLRIILYDYLQLQKSLPLILHVFPTLPIDFYKMQLWKVTIRTLLFYVIKK